VLRAASIAELAARSCNAHSKTDAVTICASAITGPETAEEVERK